MNERDFSIIIPAYNYVDLFRRALNSVLSQKDISLEIIVVDDSINNDIESYVHDINQPTIRYYHNHPAKGAIANWNYGLSLAKGKYIEVLHHDEALANDNILSEVKQQFESEHCSSVIINYKVFINGHTKKEYFIKKHLRPYFNEHPNLLFLANLLGPCACVFIKKEHIEFFDEKIRWYVDVDWYYRILRKRKISILNPHYFISSIHGHQGQITESINIQSEAIKDTKIISEKYHSSYINTLLIINKLLCKPHIKRIIKKML